MQAKSREVASCKLTTYRAGSYNIMESSTECGRVMPDQMDRSDSTFAIETHGCKLNQADTLVLAREFREAGLTQVSEDGPADVYVVNSCTVTHVADRKARQSLRSARRRNPDAVIVATGCYAERAPEQLRELEEIDLVFGNVEKQRLVQQVISWRGMQQVPCATGEDAEFIDLRVGRTRAMVKIQEGCDQVCAYCIVPKVRGRERSVPSDELVEEVNRLVSVGYREVVLTGTQLGSYGFDLAGATLKSLIADLLSGTGVERLRVSSLQPREIDEELLRKWDDERLCPHFHMPLQSGSDAVLRGMRRRYTASEYESTVGRIRAEVPGASITADVIVGFPGETDSDFQATFELCERIGFADMHVFPYSVRPGTSAAHFGEQLPPSVKAERLKALMELASTQAQRFRLDSMGDVRRVLWESRNLRQESPHWTGLTDNYIRVKAESEANLMNEITWAKLMSLSPEGIVDALVMSD